MFPGIHHPAHVTLDGRVTAVSGLLLPRCLENAKRKSCSLRTVELS